MHAPDLLTNPYLDRIVFNKVLRPVRQASGGTRSCRRATPSTGSPRCTTPTRTAYAKYLAWFQEHPIPADRGPAGRTDFKFYLVTESTEVTR